MKQVIFTLKLILFLVLAINLNGQTPDLINYQAIARDANGVVLSNQSLNIGFVIRSGSASGTIVYSEDHFGLMTNQFGLFSAQIGSGTPVIGTLSAIDWSSDSHYIEVRVNGAIIGVQQLVTVPYSFLARSVENDSVNDADSDSTNEIQTLNINNDTISISDGGFALLNSWNKDGNIGTNASNDFIGTIDSVPLSFRTNNTIQMKLYTDGRLKIGKDYRNLVIGDLAGNPNFTGSENTLIGFYAGNFMTSGYKNTALGALSLLSNTTGSHNTAIGQQSLSKNTTGYSNTALGYESLYKNTTAFNNTGIGSDALFNTTTGSRNTAIGSSALYSNTTGYDNTSIGSSSLKKNTTGKYNTANGGNALFENTTGDYNTSVGYNTLFSNTSGYNNTGIGARSLALNTTGYSNTANGYQALYSNRTGYKNTASGYLALYSNAGGAYNVAVGTESLYSNSSGNYNTANGYQSLYNNTSGHYNSAYGRVALNKNTTGSFNTAIGYYALYSNTTGDYRTAVGRSANSVGSNYDNSSGLGHNADPSASNRIHVGNTSVTSIRGQVSFTTYSDERFKKNVRKDEVKGLEFITKLTPLTYNYDIDSYAKWIEDNYGEIDSSNWDSKYDIESFRFSGFMAQDVEQIANEIGYNFSGVDKPANDKDFYGLRYAEFVVPLVKAVQEQQEIIESLNEEMNSIKLELNELKLLLNN
jgi:trimeric autotransporter adhesin